MILSEFCIKRPVFAWVLTLILVILGIVTGDRLPIRQNPKHDKNHITVEKKLPGAGPEIVENQITKIIEEAVAGIEGIETIESYSENETSKVSMDISENRDVDSVANDIRDRLSKREDQFPHDANAAILSKSGSNEKSILNFALTSAKMNDNELYTFAMNEISHTLESVPGVAKIDVWGAGDYQMKISVDPQKLSVYDLTVLDVIDAVRKQNIERPAGKILNKDREFVVTTVADVQTAEEFNEIPIKTKNGKIIKLREVAEAILEGANKNTISRFNGEKVVGIAVIAQSSANPIEVARGVKDKKAEIDAILPDGAKFVVAYDTTTFMERSLNEVYRTIFESILLVVLVVFVFLRSLKAATIPLITVPISLVGSLFIMYLFGFSVNNMTLMSFVLAIGLVVDDAIVILENVHKHIETGKSSIRAAIDGSNEVSFAVIAMTLTLCAVYAPVALATGEMGKYMKEFSVTLAGAVLLSGFIALTLSPMMCSRILEDKDYKPKQNKCTVMWDKFLEKFDTLKYINRVEEWYASMLDKVFRNRKKVLSAALFVSLFGFVVYMFMPNESQPYQDTGIFEYDGHAPHTSTLQYTQRYVDAIDAVIGEVPEVEVRQFSITNPTFEGVAVMKDRAGRSTKSVVDEIVEKVREVSGVDVRFMSGRGGGDAGGERQVSLVVRGNKSHRELREIASNLTQDLFVSGMVKEIRSTSKNEAEDYTIEILRDKASALNIEPSLIADVIDGLMRGRIAGRFKKDNKTYDVKVEIQEEYKRNPEQIKDLFVKTYNDVSRTEVMVPLTELVEVHGRTGPITIQRYNRSRSHSLFVTLKPSYGITEAVDVIRGIARKTLPDDVFVEFIGATKTYLAEANTMMLIFFLALSFIYLVMAAQFESWKDPFIIMLTVPFALVGGVLVLSWTGGTVNIFSNIGFITLIGLITKHGILMVDFANKLVEQGKDHIEAIKEASRMRLRPILMTTFAMVLGCLPLALARGSGSEIRRPLGAVVSGGMAIGTIFTIFVLPVIYSYVTSKRKTQRKNAKSTRKKLPAAD